MKRILVDLKPGDYMYLLIDTRILAYKVTYLNVHETFITYYYDGVSRVSPFKESSDNFIFDSDIGKFAFKSEEAAKKHLVRMFT